MKKRVELEKNGKKLFISPLAIFHTSKSVKTIRNNSSFVIPKHVKEINDNTFHDCKNLEYVTFPEDSWLQVIKNDVFSFTKL